MNLVFTNHNQTLVAKELASLPEAQVIDVSQSNKLLVSLFGEEQPSTMLVLLSVLVLLLHCWGINRLFHSNELIITPAKPLLMEVSMIAIAAPKPSVAPQPPAPPLVVKKPEPVKPLIKPLPKKLPPVVHKDSDSLPAEKLVAPQSAAPAEAAAESATKASETTQAATVAEAELFTEANFRANYASNPKPEYPSVAKSRDWQGKVLLRVQVTVEGLSEAVRVEKSSGHDILDEAAIEAVKGWRFIPAKRGTNAVASSVLVPIIFSLSD